VRRVAAAIRVDRLVEIWEAQPQNAAGAQNAPELFEHGDDRRQFNLLQRVHRERVVDRPALDRQPVTDVTDDVNTAVFDAVGVDPAVRDTPSAPPVQAARRGLSRHRARAADG
jgi:hypothetical protein